MTGVEFSAKGGKGVPSKFFEPQRYGSSRFVECEAMTGDQSRNLKVGDRVCWGVTTTDLGTVVGTSWNGVTIDWDDGHSTSIQHNDMRQVERVPNKLA
jgi:hypothetical protein